MNFFILFGLAAMPFLSLASDYNAICTQPSNEIKISTTSGGDIEVIVSKQFSNKISHKLSLGASTETIILFTAKNCKYIETANGSRPLKCRAKNIKAIFKNNDEPAKEEILSSVSIEINEELVTTVNQSHVLNTVKMYLKRYLGDGIYTVSMPSHTFGSKNGSNGCQFSD